MPKVLRTPPPPHLVVVDTNILWDKDKKLPVCVAFDEFWTKNSSLIPMELHVPEVVFGELHFQQTTSALKALSNIADNFTELAGITNSAYPHKCNEATVRSQVKAKLEKWLKGHAGTQSPTPVTKIDWTAVVDAAIWRKPPFTFDPKDKSNEKGFRDAVILETLVHICDAATVGKTVIFVCNDYLLRITAEARLKSSKKFLAFESLADFEAYIGLTQQQLTNAFVKSIQHHARKKFYAKADPTCIYTRFSLTEKIRKDHAADLLLQDTFTGGLGLLSAVGGSAKWNIVRRKFWIRSTQFTKLEGSREFHWSSRLDVATLNESDPPNTLLTGALPPLQKVQVVGFDVRWKANVKTDGRFHDIELLGIEKKETQSREATEENLKEWSLASA
jgi:hypothetical protein